MQSKIIKSEKTQGFHDEHPTFEQPPLFHAAHAAPVFRKTRHSAVLVPRSGESEALRRAPWRRTKENERWELGVFFFKSFLGREVTWHA